MARTIPTITMVEVLPAGSRLYGLQLSPTCMGTIMICEYMYIFVDRGSLELRDKRTKEGERERASRQKDLLDDEREDRNREQRTCLYLRRKSNNNNKKSVR